MALNAWTTIDPAVVDPLRPDIGGTATATGLKDDTPYVVEVQAGTTAGWSASGTANARTLAKPTQAPVVTAVGGYQSISLSWTSVPGATSYEYRRQGVGSWTEVTGNSGSITGLANLTAYTVEVRAKNAAGTGPSGTATATTSQYYTLPPNNPWDD